MVIPGWDSTRFSHLVASSSVNMDQLSDVGSRLADSVIT